MNFETLAYRVRQFLVPGRGFGWRTEIDPPEPEDHSQYACLARFHIEVAWRLIWEGSHSQFTVPTLTNDERLYLSGTPLGQELLQLCAAVQELAALRQPRS